MLGPKIKKDVCLPFPSNPAIFIYLLCSPIEQNALNAFCSQVDMKGKKKPHSDRHVPEAFYRVCTLEVV